MATIKKMQKIIKEYCNRDCDNCMLLPTRLGVSSCYSDEDKGRGEPERYEERFVKIVRNKIEEYCGERNCECDNCCLGDFVCDYDYNSINNLLQCYDAIEKEKE